MDFHLSSTERIRLLQDGQYCDQKRSIKRRNSRHFQTFAESACDIIRGMDAHDKTPESVELLQEKIRHQEEQLLVKDQLIAEQNSKLKWYEEQLRLQRHRQFGASSEKTEYPEQINLFNEAEDSADPKIPEPTIETITYKRPKRVPGQIAEKIKDLPVEVIDYELPMEERVCSCCNGELHEMSTQVRDELKIVPAQASIVRHVQHIYACRHCDKHAADAQASVPVIKAAMPKPLLPGSLASSSALAYIIDQKYTNHLPLYRQEQIFARLGIELSRQTMSNWIINAVAAGLDTIWEEMHQELLKRDIIHADETVLQVLRESERSAKSDSYMWLYRTGRYGPPIVLYEYQTTRAFKHPQKFLKGFKGYLQTDGYVCYNQLSDIISVGCLAHARRRYIEAIKALPDELKDKPVAAKVGLDYCNRLYSIEHKLEDVTDQERFEERLKLSKPVLDEFHSWLKKMRPQVLPKSKFGDAVKYCLNQWDDLNNFLRDGRLELDNNRAERSIKSFVISRKNFLFSNTPKGARSSAILYSLIETAKENKLKPMDYLTWLFEKLPNIDQTDTKVLQSILPWSKAVPDSCRMPDDKDNKSA